MYIVIAKTTKSFMHVAFTTYFFTPSKKEKRCQEFLVRSFIEKRKIGIAFFSRSLIRNKNSFLGKKLA